MATPKNENKQNKKTKPQPHPQSGEIQPHQIEWWKIIVSILVALIGVVSITINLPPITIGVPQISPTPPLLVSADNPIATLSIEEQISNLDATATNLAATVTKTFELTVVQLATNIRGTAEAEATLQQARTEIAASATQNALVITQAAETAQFITATAYANMTATIQASDEWREQHQFIDNFTSNEHQWNGEDSVTSVEIDQSNGILYFETNTTRNLAFWRCDFCSIPTDHNNYSFEVKYDWSTNTNNFGILFGCTQFDETLVNCQAIQIIGSSTIRVLRIGTSIEYEREDYEIKPNANNLVSVRWEVTNQILKLWINDQLIIKNVEIDGGAGGMLGLYAYPTGSTVSFDRIEILPLP